MKLFQHGFDTKEYLIFLYWRRCHEVIQADFDLASLLFACAIHYGSRAFWFDGPIQHTGRGANAAGATDSARVAAARRADRLVPRRARRTDSCGGNVSRGDCRGGPLDAESFQPQGRRVGKRSRQTVLGPERKSARTISVCS